MVQLADSVIVITGAGGGLGRQYALSAAAAGARVVVNDLGGKRDGSGSGTAPADAVAAEIRQSGGQAMANYDSVSDPDGAQRIVDTAIESFGAIHGIVNNAGILRDASMHKMTHEDWDAVMQVHLHGSFNVTRAAWPNFREQSFGRVVMATSSAGLFGNFGQVNYGTAKMGLVGMANTLAHEGASRNICVNCVAPLAATRMTADVATPELLEKLRPDFVAPVVTHLVSEGCEDSGNVYIVGGGLIRRVALFQSPDVTFDEAPTVASVASRWDEINDMSTASHAVDPLTDPAIV